jgi:hypothetical protein
MRLTCDARGAAEDEILRFEQRAGATGGTRRAKRRQDFTCESRHIDIEGSLNDPGIRANPVTLIDNDQIARNDRNGADSVDSPVSDDLGLRGKVLGERVDCSCRLLFLNERKPGVENNDRDDRSRQHRCSRDHGQCTGHPKEECEWVRELAGKIAWPGSLDSLAQFVGSEDENSTISFPR